MYDKNVYVGTSVLDLSRVCMMDFHYNTIHKEFENKHQLLYQDTDSLVYKIQNPELYDWIKNNKQYFDLSDSLRPDLKDNGNKKVLGKFKNEMNSFIIKEFTSLNPKVYSIIHDHFDKDKQKVIVDYNTKKLKGVSKAVVKNQITHKDYVQVLKTNKPISRNVVGIRSFGHEIYTYTQNKVALTSYYDKMFMSDGNTCTPFGYYKNKSS